MGYAFLTETYSTERQKILGVWAMFRDEEMSWRPQLRARSVHEQMVHQCISEDYWMRNFLGIDLTEPPLPAVETRLEFIRKYAAASSARLAKLEAMHESWYEENVSFFDVIRSRAWILVRRIAFGTPSRSAHGLFAHFRSPVIQHIRSNRRYGRPVSERRARHLSISRC